MNKYLIAVLILFSGCQYFSSSQDMEEFIPGTYVRKIDQPFAKGSDTLVIMHLQERAYQVEKRSAYRRIVHKKLLPVEHHVIKWNAVYDKRTDRLEEQRQGKIFSFDREHYTLVLGNLIYQKVK